MDSGMASAEISQDKLDKIVNLTILETPLHQIAMVTGLDGELIEQIRISQNFRNIVAERASEEFEKSDSLNMGWDEVEALSLKTLVDHLRWSKNPDMALKAAMIANRANRRNVQNKPLNVPLGSRTVIHLNQTFISKLQQNNVTPQVRDVTAGAMKKQDFLSVDGLEKLLAPAKKNEEDLLPDFEIAS